METYKENMRNNYKESLIEKFSSQGLSEEEINGILNNLFKEKGKDND